MTRNRDAPTFADIAMDGRPMTMAAPPMIPPGTSPAASSHPGPGGNLVSLLHIGVVVSVLLIAYRIIPVASCDTIGRLAMDQRHEKPRPRAC